MSCIYDDASTATREFTAGERRRVDGVHARHASSRAVSVDARRRDTIKEKDAAIVQERRS